MHGPGALHLRMLLASFLALATLILAGCYTNPVTGRKALVLLSQGEEASLGAQSFQDIRAREKVSNEPAVNARLQRIGRRIAQAVGADLPGARWEFVVFESKELNAFALPGGKVGVYTGLMALAESDSELAVVVGHEIGHVVARHGAERMSEAMVIAGVGAIGGTVVASKTEDQRLRQLFELAYGGGTTLLRVLPHSRRNETEADRMGLLYAARAGYDPGGALTFWRKMATQKKAAESAGRGSKGGSLDAIFSTHPTDEKRIADLETQVPAMRVVYEQSRNRDDT
jgi:predicted Zn-dependent protease